jgi:acyl carrier protein
MQDVLARVQKAFNCAFELDPSSVTMHTVPADIKAWDSMGHIALASSLEQEFNLTFDVDELMEMENVREIMRVVQSKLAHDTLHGLNCSRPLSFTREGFRSAPLPGAKPAGGDQIPQRSDPWAAHLPER